MIVNETSRNPKKKAKRLNSVRGTQRFTKPSQSLGSANVVINIKDAIPKLQQLSQKYIGVNNPYGFLTDLRNALGIPNSSGASKYGEVQIPQSDGSVMKVSLRITNHNSNAETYITHNANYQFNLSILVRKKFQKNRFKPHNSVVLHEYVYYGKKMENVENPLSQIVNSIIGYLQTGTYNDTTGVAMVNKSPQQTSVQTPAANTGTTENNKTENNKTDKNESKNMNRKNTIRLTESELKRIITESVKRVLREGNENVITIGSSEYGEQGFRVELGDGGLGVKQFNVYAYNEQDALDAAVDYAEKKGWIFLFWDDDESVEEYPDDFISAGNHCHQLRSGDFIVRPLNESYKRRNRR